MTKPAMSDKKQAVWKFLDSLPMDQRKDASWSGFSTGAETKLKRGAFQYHKNNYLKERGITGKHENCGEPSLKHLSELSSYEPVANWIMKHPNGSFAQCKAETGYDFNRSFFDRVRKNPQEYRDKPYVFRQMYRGGANGKTRKPTGFNVLSRFETEITEDRKIIIRQILEGLSRSGFNHLQAGIWKPLLGEDEGKEIVEVREAIR